MGLRLRLAVRVDGEADLQQHEAAEEPRPVAPVVLMTLRDIEGWESIEVCNVLEVRLPGPPVPPDAKAQLLQAFRRRDER